MRSNAHKIFGVAAEGFVNTVLTMNCKKRMFLFWLANEILNEECAALYQNGQSSIVLKNADRLSKMKYVFD